MMRKFIYCRQCPAHGDCSAAAWKRAAAWGWSIDEAQGAVVRHLMSSGLHNLDHEDAVELSDAAEYVEAEHEVDQEADEHEGGKNDGGGKGDCSRGQGHKRQRRQGRFGFLTQPRARMGDADARDPAQIWQRNVETMRALDAERMRAVRAFSEIRDAGGGAQP